MREQPSKTSKTRHFGVLWSKSSNYYLNCEKITNDKILVLSIAFPNDHFFQYEFLSKPIRKDRKISQYSAGSDPLSCFGPGHVTVLSKPPQAREYPGIRQLRCSSGLDFCSVCSELKE